MAWPADHPEWRRGDGISMTPRGLNLYKRKHSLYSSTHGLETFCNCISCIFMSNDYTWYNHSLVSVYDIHRSIPNVSGLQFMPVMYCWPATVTPCDVFSRRGPLINSCDVLMEKNRTRESLKDMICIHFRQALQSFDGFHMASAGKPSTHTLARTQMHMRIHTII